jgi:hypothetical protein
VFVRKGAIARAITYVEDHHLSHLALFPEFYSAGLLLDAATSAFARSVCVSGRIWQIEDETKSPGFGSGGFNLVRRETLERSKGFEWLRMEVCDDAALGHLLKKEGNRSAFLNGRDYMGVYFYETLGGLARGTERACWTVIGGFSLLRMCALAVLMGLLELSPFIALIPVGVAWLPLAAVSLLLASYGSTIVVNLWLTRFQPGMLLWPLGIVLAMVLMVRAGMLGRLRNGIYWRGTFYSTDQLKAGQRLRF